MYFNFYYSIKIIFYAYINRGFHTARNILIIFIKWDRVPSSMLLRSRCTRARTHTHTHVLYTMDLCCTYILFYSSLYVRSGDSAPTKKKKREGKQTTRTIDCFDCSGPNKFSYGAQLRQKLIETIIARILVGFCRKWQDYPAIDQKELHYCVLVVVFAGTRLSLSLSLPCIHALRFITFRARLMLPAAKLHAGR
uniref:Uncharacterized protein n=1 Tax=Trichogramma kaykai TaxID=54128 RepID=A0ABD2WVZ7_9HYME